jgi:2-C-methyl-D-erythritol 2,4-cyclodiphosphate synthase
MVKTGIGQDSHRFVTGVDRKPLILGGVEIQGCPGLEGNSDADVVLHALTNAISGISGVNILGAVSDDLCLNRGITDSRVYLRRALETLRGYTVTHVSISVECKRPHLAGYIDQIKKSVAAVCSLDPSDVGCTATTGEGLTGFGRGEGIQVFAVVTAQKGLQSV